MESNQYSSIDKVSPRRMKLRIYLIDNEFKTIYLDKSSRVLEVLEILSGKMNIDDIDSFGIFEEWTHNNKTEDRLLSNDHCIFEQKSRKIERKLVLKCKLFRELNIINANDSSTHLYYIQIKSNILSGYYYAGLSNAIALAAIQMQIEFGPFFSNKHKPGFMQSRIRDFVSSILLEKYGGKHMELEILKAYSHNAPKTLLLLKKCYVLEAMKLSIFGCRFFPARQRKLRALPEHLMIGVNSNGISLIRSDTKEFLRQWKFNDLFRWGSTDSAFYMQLRSMKDSNAGSIWELFTNEAEHVCDLLNLYQNCILQDIESLPQRVVISEDLAVIKIQACWRGYLLRKRLEVVKKIMACKVIAQAWIQYKNL